MRTYTPLPVTQHFTDEWLSGPETIFSRPEAEKLLSVPAEYRQSVEMEVNARSSVTHRGGQQAISESTDDACRVRSEVVAEVLAQLAKENADA